MFLTCFLWAVGWEKGFEHPFVAGIVVQNGRAPLLMDQREKPSMMLGGTFMVWYSMVCCFLNLLCWIFMNFHEMSCVNFSARMQSWAQLPVQTGQQQLHWTGRAPGAGHLQPHLALWGSIASRTADGTCDFVVRIRCFQAYFCIEFGVTILSWLCLVPSGSRSWKA